MLMQGFRNFAGEAVAVDGQCAASRDGIAVSRSDDEGIKHPHLFLQYADRIG
jgi:hypothetical protein